MIKVSIMLAILLLPSSEAFQDDKFRDLIEQRCSSKAFSFRSLALEQFFTEDVVSDLSENNFLPTSYARGGWERMGAPEIRIHLVHGKDDADSETPVINIGRWKFTGSTGQTTITTVSEFDPLLKNSRASLSLKVKIKKGKDVRQIQYESSYSFQVMEGTVGWKLKSEVIDDKESVGKE